ncbi:MAG TPA: PAS domain S-box protein, partial [Elusimicrobiales bacterium]|nr:PAS domain S-box protein [Elusimicrobiales bacterium]
MPKKKPGKPQPAAKARPLKKTASISLEALFNSVPFYACVKDMQGRFLFANDRFAKACGCKTSGDLKGKTTPSVCPEYLLGACRSEDAQRLLASGQQLRQEVVCSAGSYFDVLQALITAPDGKSIGVLGMAREVTQSHEAQQRFETVFRASPIPMALATAPERRFVELNDAFPRTTGYSRQEASGKTSRELGLFEESAEAAAFAETLRRDGRAA